MKESKFQITQRSAPPTITTRSRHDRLTRMLVKEVGTISPVPSKTRKGRISNTSTGEKYADPMKTVNSSDTSLSPANQNKLDKEMVLTKLPSISNILGEDHWRGDNNTPYNGRNDPFYSGYSKLNSVTPSPLVVGLTHKLTVAESVTTTVRRGNNSDEQMGQMFRFSLDMGTARKLGSRDGDAKTTKSTTRNRLVLDTNTKDNSKEGTVSPESESDSNIKIQLSRRKGKEDDLLPEIKSKSKVKIEGTHTFQSTQNKKLRKEHPKRYKKIKRWTQEEDKLIIHYKEELKKSWKDIETVLDSKHSWQAIQMRYLRCHKSRNNTWKNEDVEKLLMRIQEDFDSRNKRILVEMGPSFSAQRIATKINQLAVNSDNLLLKFYAADDNVKEEDEYEDGMGLGLETEMDDDDEEDDDDDVNYDET